MASRYCHTAAPGSLSSAVEWCFRGLVQCRSQQLFPDSSPFLWTFSSAKRASATGSEGNPILILGVIAEFPALARCLRPRQSCHSAKCRDHSETSQPIPRVCHLRNEARGTTLLSHQVKQQPCPCLQLWPYRSFGARVTARGSQFFTHREHSRCASHCPTSGLQVCLYSEGQTAPWKQASLLYAGPVTPASALGTHLTEMIMLPLGDVHRT